MFILPSEVPISFQAKPTHSEFRFPSFCKIPASWSETENLPFDSQTDDELNLHTLSSFQASRGEAPVSYWRVYIVMIKPKGEKLFRELPLTDISGGATVAYSTRAAAVAVCKKQKEIHGARRAYVQKCGAYR